jgi:hypothetical protein
LANGSSALPVQTSLKVSAGTSRCLFRAVSSQQFSVNVSDSRHYLDRRPTATAVPTATVYIRNNLISSRNFLQRRQMENFSVRYFSISTLQLQKVGEESADPAVEASTVEVSAAEASGAETPAAEASEAAVEFTGIETVAIRHGRN